MQIELRGDSKGAIRIAFYSPDDLDRIMGLVIGERRSELEA